KMVWSRPMPVPSPDQNRVPRWRTMISPPLTVWPEKTFTPSILGLESRPFLEEPSPFLCAISGLLFGRRLFGCGLARGRLLRGGLLLACAERGDLEPGQLGTVTPAAAVALLGLVLEDSDLVTPEVFGHLRLDLDLAELVGADDQTVAAHHHRPQSDLVAFCGL